MERLGYPRRAERVIRRAVGWGDRNLLKPFVSGRDLPEALQIYRRHHARSLVAKSRLFPGVRRMLRALKGRGFCLAVATNRPTRFTRILIRHLRIDAYLDMVLCADRVKKGKPHPQILNTIMRRLGQVPGRTVYVGDMHIDAQAGRRAKVRTVMVTTGSSRRDELAREKPSRILSRVTGLTALL